MPTPQPTIETSTPSSLSGRFIVMPEVFVPKEKKKLSSTAVLAIVLSVVVVLVGIVLVLFLTREEPTTPVQQTPVVSEPVVQQPTPQPQQPTPQPQPTPEPQVPVVQVQLPSFISGVFTSSTDTDQDSLTDIEEQLFLTSPSVPDTDQDSFLDGIELRNQYDPATPRALLEVSPQIKIARNESLGYQLLIPLAWTATKSTADGKEFLVRPDQGTESFRITVYENADRLGVTEWLQQQQPGVNLTQFVNFHNESNWVGVQTQDHTVIISAFDDGGPGSRALMFVMHYDVGQETELRYSAVWDMMVNSLAVATGNTVPAP